MTNDDVCRYIACETNSYKCIDNERDNNEGKNAQISYRTAFISMQHRFVENTDGTFKIINRISGLALSSGEFFAKFLRNFGKDPEKSLELTHVRMSRT
jgi:hypothetical protein